MLERATRFARRHAWFARDVLLPFAITRVALTLAGLSGLFSNDARYQQLLPSSHAWLNIWSIWDTRWYLTIARDGYSYVPGQESSAAFAPALPLLMRGVGLVLGRSDDDAYLLAGLIVSNVALLVALGFLVALVRLDFEAAVARRSVLYLLVFPTTLFLSAVYPHSLFLALAISAFYYARRGHWWVAGILGGLAGLTRLQAGLIVVPLAFQYLATLRFDIRRLRSDVLALGLVPLGTLGFTAYLYWLTGEPLAVFRAGSAWHRQLTPPWEVLRPYVTEPFGNHGGFHSPVDLGFTILMLVMVVYAWQRLRASLAVFATVFFLMIISSGMLMSSPRYALELFPGFVALAISGRRPVFHHAFVAGCAAVSIQFMINFGGYGWVA